MNAFTFEERLTTLFGVWSSVSTEMVFTFKAKMNQQGVRRREHARKGGYENETPFLAPLSFDPARGPITRDVCRITTYSNDC